MSQPTALRKRPLAAVLLAVMMFALIGLMPALPAHAEGESNSTSLSSVELIHDDADILDDQRVVDALNQLVRLDKLEDAQIAVYTSDEVSKDDYDADITELIIKRLHRDRVTMKMQRKLAAKKEAQLTEKWGAVTKQHDQLKKRVLGAETDWDMLFRYPVLSDVSYPSTAKLYEAMKAADLIDSTRPSSVDEDTDVSTLAYPKAVSAFKLAWDVAMRNARKIGQDDVPVEERRKIKQIRDILALAENAGSSQNERTMAYNRAYSMIKELRSIQVPDAVMHSIEEKKRLMIEAMEIEIITT